MSEIDDLHPMVGKLAKKHIGKCREAGLDLFVYCTYRSWEEQAKLYAKGRTAPGEKVTNAKPGQSFHNFRVAYDCGPVIDGKIAWNREDLFEKIGRIGVSLGLEWGGNFKSIRDLPHFQYTGGLTLKDFQSGKTLKRQLSLMKNIKFILLSAKRFLAFYVRYFSEKVGNLPGGWRTAGQVRG